MMLKNGEQKFLYRKLLGLGGLFMQQLSGFKLIELMRCFPLCVSLAYILMGMKSFEILELLVLKVSHSTLHSMRHTN